MGCKIMDWIKLAYGIFMQGGLSERVNDFLDAIKAGNLFTA